MKALAPWLMFAALAVAAPRMAYLFVAMDGQGVEGWGFVVVLLVAGATSVTFTGGQAWLAWRIATYRHHRIKLWCAWVAILSGAAVLGTFACLLRLTDDGEVLTATSPKWLVENIPSVVLALVVGWLPEIFVAAVAVGHGDGGVVDDELKRAIQELTDQGVKLLEEEANARHAVEELRAVRKRAEVAEALVKTAAQPIRLEAKKPAATNGNGSVPEERIEALNLLRQGMGRSEVARKVGRSRSTIGRWEKEAG